MATLIAQVTSGGPMFFVLILVALLVLTLVVALRKSGEPEEDLPPAPPVRHSRPEPLPRRVPPVHPEPDLNYLGRHGRDPVGPPVTINRLQVPGSPPWQPALKPPEASLRQPRAVPAAPANFAPPETFAPLATWAPPAAFAKKTRKPPAPQPPPADEVA